MSETFHKEQSSIKCGEVFYNEHGKISFVCLICGDFIEKSEQFSLHILQHISDEVSIEIKQEPNEENNLNAQYLCEVITKPEPSKINTVENTTSNIAVATYIKQEPDAEQEENTLKETIEVAAKFNLNYFPSHNLTQFKTQTKPITKECIISFKCEFCDEPFPCLGQKTNHENSIHNKMNQPYLCIWCSASFSSKSESDQHQQLHNLLLMETSNGNDGISQIKICQFCEQLFRSKQDLDRHQSQSQQQLEITENSQQRPQIKCDENVVCKLCNGIILNINTMQHLTTQHKEFMENELLPGETLIECTICQNKYPVQYLSIHFNLIHKLNDRKYLEMKCPICKLSIASAMFMEHYSNHHDDNNLKLTKNYYDNYFDISCKECNEQFRLIDYPKHLKTIHNPENSQERIKCPDCDKIIYRRYLDQHWRDNHDLSRRKFECFICKHPTNYIKNLRVHMKRHSDERPHECTICKKRFKQKYTGLKIHMKSKHSNERPFVCVDCGKCFVVRSQLVIHIRNNHSTDPPRFPCNICNKLYTSNYWLKVHLLTHGDERPFVCTVCGKGFKNSHVLKMHQRIHNVDRPRYPCRYCFKTFGEGGGRNRHERNVHSTLVQNA